jgi:hypothetical protein
MSEGMNTMKRRIYAKPKLIQLGLLRRLTGFSF